MHIIGHNLQLYHHVPNQPTAVAATRWLGRAGRDGVATLRHGRAAADGSNSAPSRQAAASDFLVCLGSCGSEHACLPFAMVLTLSTNRVPTSAARKVEDCC